MKILIPRIQREESEMVDIGNGYKTRRKIKTKRARNNFKKNMPKKLRKEWGERMDFFRSL